MAYYQIRNDENNTIRRLQGINGYKSKYYNRYMYDCYVIENIKSINKQKKIIK